MSKEKIQNQNLDKNGIAIFIKNWRLNEGLSMKEFSELANVHFNSIYNLEHNKGINLSTLIKCIDAMDGMTLPEFFSGLD